MKKELCIGIKRAWEPAEKSDGKRILVDRLWPRGVSKVKLKAEQWLKEVSPSSELREWFQHDPEKWEEFQRRYFAELTAKPDAWKPLLECASKESVTLVYGARDEEHNNAVALRNFLRAQQSHRSRAREQTVARRNPAVTKETASQPRKTFQPT